jgi:prepilin-type N-terminal cleavage/methylation domain-containing protein/uncharacterized protein (TIGR02145 family)
MEISNSLFRKNRAFTLIELLVVIAIIGILAGIIVVSMSGATGAANDARRKTDINQLSKAVMIYKANNLDTALPVVTCTIGGSCPAGVLTVLGSASSLRDPDGTYYTYSSIDGNNYTIAANLSNGLDNYTFDSLTGLYSNVSVNPLISIENITGTPTIGSVLTAGSVMPSGAAVSYQWQRASTPEGVYSDISGAIASTYILTTDDLGKYIKVRVVGTGNYSGMLTSAATALILGNVVFTYNGNSVTYGTVYNPVTNRVWLDRNLGATRVAISSTDSAAYGDTFQWGRPADGHQVRTSTTTSTLSVTDTPGHGSFILKSSSPYDWRSPQNANLWQGLNGVNNPCPAGFRIPTEAELFAEKASWSSQDGAGAFASPLKLTVAGYRRFNGALMNVNTYGDYWSSDIDGTYSRDLYFGNGVAIIITTEYRAFGFSVRCIKD